MKKITLFTSTILLFSTIFSFGSSTEEVLNTLKTDHSAEISINPYSGVAEFIRFPLGEQMELDGSTPRAKALEFLNLYGEAFGVNDVESTLQFEEEITDNYGLKHVVFNQVYQKVPVFDGQLKFHFNANLELSSINGVVVQKIKMNPIPSLSLEKASDKAISAIESQDLNKSGVPLFVVSNELFVFQKGLVENYFGGNFLVYRVEVRNDADVREYLFINAHTGTIVEQYTGMAHALNRIVYEGDTNTIVWQEGDEFPGTLDQWQQNEVVASEHVYNFFLNAFGYRSYDGADAIMRTINNNPNVSCPNATWNGSTANYCDGTATDDVIAHEWGHAYTEYTNNLIYAWQSGALNEAFSDIWGETVDLLNGYEDEGEDLSNRTGCASSDRWLMGEDATAFGGAIRDMWDPNCFGHPATVSDAQYWCSTVDGGGVHSNSGVPNHIYALLVDGGTLNSETINAIGFTKAAHIFWRAQSIYLTQSSDFYSFADALDAACTDLVGINLEGLSTTSTAAGLSGEMITVADCNEVAKAIGAAQLRANPESCGFQPILAATDPLCDAATSDLIFFEDWESGMGDWTVSQAPENPGTWTSRDWELTNLNAPNVNSNRIGTGVYGIDPGYGDCAADLENGIIRLQSPIITLSDETDGAFELSFNHYVSTEAGYDGGNIKIRIGRGAWELIPASAFISNPYNATLVTSEDGSDNPLAGEDAFSGADGGQLFGSWGQSTINLNLLGVSANETIQLMWEMGTDGCAGNVGWLIDEVMIYNCASSLSVESFNKMIEGVSIYPNPTNEILTIKKFSNLNLIKAEIYDLNGRMIKRIDLENMNTEKTIDVSNLSSGLYIINVASDTAKGQAKLVIE